MPQRAKPLKKWALYAYLAGNVPEDQMHEAAIKHLLQMARVGSSETVYLAAQIYLPGLLPRRYILPEASQPGGAVNIAPDPSQPNANSADPRSIMDFIQWAGEKCPAENTMVVLWGHGYGIDDYTPPKAHMHSAGQGIQALRMIAPPAENPALRNWDLQSQDLSDRYGFIYDWPAGEVIPNTQVGQAVRAAGRSLPNRVKPAILGFDSCEMAMAEVWCEMVGCATLGIASQAPIPYQGWPYDVIVKWLLRNSEARPEAVAHMIVREFARSYAGGNNDFVTLSALDIGAINSLAKTIRPLAVALAAVVSNPEAQQAIFEARNHCPIYDPDGFIDLGCFCKFLEVTMPNSSVSAACGPVLRALKRLVLTSDYSPQDSGKKISQSTGLSVWFPGWIESPSIRYLEKERSIAYLGKGYSDTKFAQATGWDTFLAGLRKAMLTR
jgi:hypothetical protein